MKIWQQLLAKRRALFNFAVPLVLVVILFALAATPAYADTVSSSYEASSEYSETITVDNAGGVVDLNKDNDDEADEAEEAAAEAAAEAAEAAAEADEAAAEAAAEADEAAAEAAAEADEAAAEAAAEAPTVLREPVWSYPTSSPSSGGGAVASIENDEVIQSTDIDIPSETTTAIINSPEEFPESITETSADGELVLDEGGKIAGVNSQASQRLALYSHIATAVIDVFPVVVQNTPLYIKESLATLQEWAEVFRQQFPSEIQQELDKLLLDVQATLKNHSALISSLPAEIEKYL